MNSAQVMNVVWIFATAFYKQQSNTYFPPSTTLKKIVETRCCDK